MKQLHIDVRNCQFLVQGPCDGLREGQGIKLPTLKLVGDCFTN